jgi:hypothetical protein
VKLLTKYTLLEQVVKKLLFLIPLISAVVFYSSYATADDDDYDDGDGYSQPIGGYYREEIIYYPQPQVQYYSPPPQVNYYYPLNSRPNAYYDQRSPQGLMGGVVGSVLGYEIGYGNPIGAGLGAAVATYMGNGW